MRSIDFAVGRHSKPPFKATVCAGEHPGATRGPPLVHVIRQTKAAWVVNLCGPRPIFARALELLDSLNSS